jgi:peptidoglycan/LPS O-acetylase OafA/YrhL
MNRIPELDGVRALAIALVIGCHYQAFAIRLGGLPEFGWVGVEIFFVLSGYLITTILLELRGHPRAYRIFYARRIRRIVPPYFITVILAALFEAAFKLHLDFRTLLLQAGFLTSFANSGEILSGALHALLIHTAPPLFAAPRLAAGLPGAELHNLKAALSHTWSLSVEEWFYILWAPTVLAFGRRGIAWGASIALVLGFVLRWASGVDGITWYMNFFCRFDLLGIGALLALWMDRRAHIAVRRRRAGDRLLAGLALAALAGLAAILWRIRPFLGREIRNAPLFAAYGTILIGLAVAGLIAHLIHSSRRPSPLAWLFRLPPLVWLGRRSYTIYLAHLPWYWVVCAFLGVAGRASWTAALVSLALALLTAALSWRYVEEPLLRHRTEPMVTASR